MAFDICQFEIHDKVLTCFVVYQYDDYTYKIYASNHLTNFGHNFSTI